LADVGLRPQQFREQLSADDWRRIGDALRYLGQDLHHRSFSVTAERRELLWEEMDQCLALADRLSSAQADHAISPEARFSER